MCFNKKSKIILGITFVPICYINIYVTYKKKKSQFSNSNKHSFNFSV